MRFSAFALCLVITPALAANPPWPAQPVLTLKPQMQQLVAADATLEQLATGFRWAEGPVAEPDTGDILFSDGIFAAIRLHWPVPGQ
jgi:gluconolactonase